MLTRFRFAVLPLLFSALAWMGAGCSSDTGNKDAVAEAKFQNEKRINDAAVTEKQERDAEFMVMAASGGLLEVELGKTAQLKGTLPATKAFGQQMVTHHTEANNALKTLAARKNIVLPQTLGGKHQEVYTRLVGLTGSQFDKEYAKAMVADHKDDVDAFEDMSEEAYDGDIRGYAAKYLPALRDHLDQAEELEDQTEKLP